MSRYGKIVICIAFWDLLITILLMANGSKEAGLLLWWYLEFSSESLILFAALKISITLLAVGLIEISWQREYIAYDKVGRYYEIAIWSYFFLYLIGVFVINYFYKLFNFFEPIIKNAS